MLNRSKCGDLFVNTLFSTPSVKSKVYVNCTQCISVYLLLSSFYVPF